MKLLCFGKNGGTFTDRRTNRDVEYYKLSVLKNVEQRDERDTIVVGQSCEKISMTRSCFFTAPDKAEDYAGGLLLECEFNDKGVIVSVELADD